MRGDRDKRDVIIRPTFGGLALRETLAGYGNGATDALRSLVGKLEECAPHIGDAFVHRELRCGPYDGPDYARELTIARQYLALIGAPEASPSASPVLS